MYIAKKMNKQDRYMIILKNLSADNEFEYLSYVSTNYSDSNFAFCSESIIIDGKIYQYFPNQVQKLKKHSNIKFEKVSNFLPINQIPDVMDSKNSSYFNVDDSFIWILTNNDHTAIIDGKSKCINLKYFISNRIGRVLHAKELKENLILLLSNNGLWLHDFKSQTDFLIDSNASLNVSTFDIYKENDYNYFLLLASQKRIKTAGLFFSEKTKLPSFIIDKVYSLHDIPTPLKITMNKDILNHFYIIGMDNSFIHFILDNEDVKVEKKLGVPIFDFNLNADDNSIVFMGCNGMIVKKIY